MVLATVRTLIERLMRLFHGFVVEEASPEIVKIVAADPEQYALSEEQQAFWKKFLPNVKLDDPEQQMAKLAVLDYISFMLPRRPQRAQWNGPFCRQRVLSRRCNVVRGRAGIAE
jgi:hypothetical protein